MVFVGLNIAGCGGGGGGSSVTSPTPSTNALVIVLRDINGSPVNGSVTLAGVTMNTVNGRASFSNVRAGTYSVTTVVSGTKTTTSIVVTAGAGPDLCHIAFGCGHHQRDGARALKWHR